MWTKREACANRIEKQVLSASSFTWEGWIWRSWWSRYRGVRVWQVCRWWKIRPSSGQPSRAWYPHDWTLCRCTPPPENGSSRARWACCGDESWSQRACQEDHTLRKEDNKRETNDKIRVRMVWTGSFSSNIQFSLHDMCITQSIAKKKLLKTTMNIPALALRSFLIRAMGFLLRPLCMRLLARAWT